MEKENTDSYRGNNFCDEFFDNFKKSVFYNEIYKKHKNELIIGVRDGYINIYHNCDSIAKIQCSKANPDQIKGELAEYYLTGDNSTLQYKKRTGEEIIANYEIIKENSQKREKSEKQAQERLFIDNNMNADSDWFCIDVEYAKRERKGWRFDIIAVSKAKPFRVALIELKYGSDAIGGNSGITKHIKDYYKFHTGNSIENLIPELVSIINVQIRLGIDVPQTLHYIKAEDFEKTPEYYFITLNNNKEKAKETLPEGTMAGYLFTKDNAPKDWKTTNYSRYAGKEGYYATVGEDKSFKPVFLFSEATLPNIGIYGILDERYYTKKIVE